MTLQASEHVKRSTSFRERLLFPPTNGQAYAPDLDLLACLHKVERSLLIEHVNPAGVVHIADGVTLIRHKDHLRSESSADELAAAFSRLSSLSTKFPQHLSDSRAVLRVQIGVDLIEEVERCRVALLDGKDKCQRAERLLSARELLDALLLVVLGVEGHCDADARVVLYTSLAAVSRSTGAFGFLFGFFGRGASLPIGSSLDYEAAFAGRYELYEDLLEILGHLLEGTGDSLVFPLVEHIDEVADRLARCVKLTTSSC